MTQAIQKQAAGNDFRSLIQASQSKLAEVAPKWLSVERLTRLALAAQSRNPMLAQCSPQSYLLFCMKCAETGLEPIGAGGAWAVPFRNNQNNTVEVQFIPDWRGLISLAKRSGQIKHAEARIVYANDHIEYELGDTPKLVHRPNLDDPGEFKGVYCIVTLPDGQKHIEYMRRTEVEKVRNSSKAKNGGPWKEWYDMMAIKTVVRRAMKPFASSPEMHTAIEADNESTGIVDVTPEPIALPTATEAPAIEAPVAAVTPEPEPQQPEPAQQPEPTAQPTQGGGKRVVGKYGKPYVTTGTGKKGTWTKTSVNIREEWYGTFDRDLAAALDQLTGAYVEIAFETDAKGYHVIQDVQAADAPPQE